ncbi:hypothetical protein F4814DRAFT_428225 [Daldinia grandis]|nr:hypothetical protein F4814DRAFT_428225 [Daldinia grandis]
MYVLAQGSRSFPTASLCWYVRVCARASAASTSALAVHSSRRLSCFFFFPFVHAARLPVLEWDRVVLRRTCGTVLESLPSRRQGDYRRLPSGLFLLLVLFCLVLFCFLQVCALGRRVAVDEKKKRVQLFFSAAHFGNAHMRSLRPYNFGPNLRRFRRMRTFSLPNVRESSHVYALAGRGIVSGGLRVFSRGLFLPFSVGLAYINRSIRTVSVGIS